jgi:hypothetical protein
MIGPGGTDMMQFAHEGAILFYLLLAGVLTLILGVTALIVLRRAILRNMMRTSGHGPPSDDRPRRQAQTQLAFDTAMASIGAGDAAMRLLWRHAAAHIVAGLAFAAVATVVFFQFGGLEYLPLRTAVVVWAYAWPTVLMLGILVGRDWRVQALIAVVYFGVLLIICTISALRNTPPLALFGISLPGFFQPQVFWLIMAAPSGFLLLFLNRAIRSVGPLVLLFVFAMLLGSHAVTTLLLFESVLQAAAQIAVALRIDGGHLLLIVQGIGALLGIWPAWRCVAWLRDRYAAKRSSDLLLIGDAIWLLMALVIWIDLFRDHGALASLVAPLPWIAWRLTLRATIHPLLKEARKRPPMRLLLLRVYGFGRRSRRLLDLLGTRWRLIGSIDLIAAPDLASRTVEPAIFLEFVRGRLQRLFIRSPDDLKTRIASLDHGPDADARFRINQLFCADDMWKAAVTHLMGEASLVAMDLRGFGPHRRGCVYELETLLDTVPLDRLVFLVDWSTDRKGLEAVLFAHWQRLAADSPNLAAARPGVRLLDVGDSDAAAVRALLAIAEERQETASTG